MSWLNDPTLNCNHMFLFCPRTTRVCVLRRVFTVRTSAGRGWCVVCCPNTAWLSVPNAHSPASTAAKSLSLTQSRWVSRVSRRVYSQSWTLTFFNVFEHQWINYQIGCWLIFWPSSECFVALIAQWFTGLCMYYWQHGSNIFCGFRLHD